ncbi:hypothetical protein [Inhella proteolytica]|uniref:SH3 domain-containing protein n=1 Tax=Inhella proteolytica TaxID=2795029 RepID=A0A931J9R7_9BURK|nr:hypothetical protein [Inhella proteolytica]MBH9579402.1 hypothetical protein [Inhella proteolytica]
MRIALLLALAVGCHGCAWAQDKRCEQLSQAWAKAEPGFNPSLEAKVVAPQGLPVHLGPDRSCPTLKTLARGEFVTAYAVRKGWVQVGLLVNGDWGSAWVAEAGLELIAPYGADHPSRQPAQAASASP